MLREEAINILYGMRADNLNLDDLYIKDKYEALGMAINALEQNWIPINSPKELPHDCDLFVTHGIGDASWVGTVYWDMTEWSDNVDDVTAYMRYPKPYKAESEEDGNDD